LSALSRIAQGVLKDRLDQNKLTKDQHNALVKILDVKRLREVIDST
jgi:hypothetical protein